ncbi:hypothetical protein [Bradyrhizobium sp. AUGA SZCCT0431]|uniref:hypothetical protein n=1 Tax=Bradyrhizobium sp. AUGA SZCCT0431 TaxID=2807674 RepID=UPI001BA5529C|nr:hypothetical protein [Bradyrhizobium sp. AUGA SZCCT0431]MBR1142812.1 hypothetical protein [Bradyrhizobium sp. AUGA SZCCT0431]
MNKNELSLDELNKVAGGMIKQTGPRLPTGTGPTFPTDPFPFPIPFIPLGPFRF